MTSVAAGLVMECGVIVSGRFPVRPVDARTFDDFHNHSALIEINAIFTTRWRYVGLHLRMGGGLSGT